MIALDGIEKTFSNGVKALDGASLELQKGEIHAVLGENGAGKSTLMHVLVGFLRADRGIIVVDGRERCFSGYADAIRAGIGIVRQHPSIADGFPTWAVCAFGAEDGFLFTPEKTRARVESICEAWGFHLPLDRDSSSLTASQRQTVAVIYLLLHGCSAFVFDEVTAVLSPYEIERLFTLLGQLKQNGASIALVSHKLDETLSVADRVTVLRRGKTIASFGARESNVKTLSELMFGEKLKVEGWKVKAGEREKILCVRNLVITGNDELPFLRDVTMNVTRGSIAGVSGVRDSGTETLELALTGFLKWNSGIIYLNGVEMDGNPRTFRGAGGAYLAADRMSICLAPNLSLWDNLVIHTHRKNRFFLDKNFLNDWVATIMENTETQWGKEKERRSAKETARSFSGGQLQQFVLERELAENAGLLVLSEPFWGLDTQACAYLIQRLNFVTRHGGAVLVFSTDIDNLIPLCDEIFVLRDGRITKNINNSTGNRKQQLTKAMV
ncbi:MAG: ATP-binding cassette domain-containing protein [Treponema sp.]|jgi:simple sugar transport system ATP-binding protein|nr:ATP-binding cassette domain-containing protein [Treponema sp.]